MEVLLAIIPWLAVLACPLMMLVMMRLMPGGSCHRKAEVTGGEITIEEIRRLQARVIELEEKSGKIEVYK